MTGALAFEFGRFEWLRAGALASALVVSACDGGASAVKAVKGGERASVEHAGQGQDRGGQPAWGETGNGAPSAFEANDRRDDPREAPVWLISGRPMWAANRSRGAEENAQRGFERFGEAFAARDVDDYVRKTHAFVSKPPAGSQTLKRANGDTLIYDPAGNVFAVVARSGAPRTMFKPDDGADYWRRQKEGQTRRTAGSDRRDSSG